MQVSVQEIGILCCLQLASKFCEDILLTLNVNMLHKSHGILATGINRFDNNLLISAEIEAFEILNYCVDFQDSFFLFVEELIFGLAWGTILKDNVTVGKCYISDEEVIHANMHFICDHISSMIYIKALKSIVFEYPKVC